MFKSFKEKAAGIASAATGVVAEIDIEGVKGKVTTTVKGTGNTITQRVSSVSERIKDRVSDPAEAYDAALDELLKSVEHSIRDIDFIILKDRAELLRKDNPYRN